MSCLAKCRTTAKYRSAVFQHCIYPLYLSQEFIVRFSALPLAIGAAAIALTGLVTPTANAADVTFENDMCQIYFTDGEIQFFQSKFAQARTTMINDLKAEIPAATAELNELQRIYDEASIEDMDVEFYADNEVLIRQVSAKAADAGFRSFDNGSEISNEVDGILQYLPLLAPIENLGIAFWDIRYNHDTDSLQLFPTSAPTIFEAMDLPFVLRQVMEDESPGASAMAERGLKILEDSFVPLQDLRAPLTPVFEACENGIPGTDIWGDETDETPGDIADDKTPAAPSTGSSFGSS